MVKKTHAPIIPSVWDFITSERILKNVGNMKSSKSNYFYVISNWFLKQNIYCILLLLALRFNASLTEDVIPSRLNISRITPLFKQGDRFLSGSYRLISNVPVIGKLFEILLEEATKYIFWREQSSNYRMELSTIDVVGSLVLYTEWFKTLDY